MWVGMKGASGYGNPDDASTAGTSEVSDEERSESRDRSRSGLSGCLSLSPRTVHSERAWRNKT